MNAIIKLDYQIYRRWFERSLDLIWRLPHELRSKADPMEEVSKAEQRSQGSAIRSVSMGIKDTVAMTDRYSAADIKILDAAFEADSLPSLTAVRAMVVSRLDRIIKRGLIVSDEEFYSLKSLEDCDLSEGVRGEVQRLLGVYEIGRLMGD